MRPGQDPTTCFQEAGFLRDELERMGECVTEQSLKSFLIQEMAEEDKDALFASYREAKFDLGYTENTMRNLYLDNFSRRNATEGRHRWRRHTHGGTDYPRPRCQYLRQLQRDRTLQLQLSLIFQQQRR